MHFRTKTENESKENFFFFFCPYLTACGILVPQPGIEPGPTAVKAPNLNPWVIREDPVFKLDSYLKYVLKWIKQLNINNTKSKKKT